MDLIRIFIKCLHLRNNVHNLFRIFCLHVRNNMHNCMVCFKYRIAGMFGWVNVWRIAELKVIGEIKFGEWIDFGHKDTIYQLKFD